MTSQVTLKTSELELFNMFTDSIKAGFSQVAADLEKLRKQESMPEEIRRRREKVGRDNEVKDLVKRMLTDYNFAKEVNLSWEDFVRELEGAGGTDQISMEELRVLIPGAMTDLMGEPMEPEYIGVQLLETIRTRGTLSVNFPVWSGMADAEEVGPGNEYPIRKFAVQGQGFVRLGKYGLRVEVQDEVLRYVVGFDILGRVIRAARRAMGRTKEKRIFSHLTALGRTFIDNLDTNVRNAGGVNQAGAQNGTLILDDLVEASGDLMNNGFQPDLILINGLAWTIFARTPEIRDFAMVSAQGPLWKWPQASPQPTHSLAKASPYGYGWEAPAPLATMFTNPDASLLGRSFRTAVTPYMPFTAGASSTPDLTNIIVADSRYLGAIFQDEDVTTEEFSDPRIDVQSTKFRERYAIGVAAEGEGIRVLRNIPILRGLDPWNQSFVNDVSPTLPGPKTAISW